MQIFKNMPYVPINFKLEVKNNLIRGIYSIFNDGLLCDLKVSVSGKTFACHRLILASASGYFRSLASSFWEESRTGEVKLEHEDVTAESFQMLLDILYKSENVIDMSTAKDVLRMASYLQVSLPIIVTVCIMVYKIPFGISVPVLIKTM